MVDKILLTKQSRKPSVEVNTEISRRDASSATGYNFNVLARSGQQGKWNGSIGAGIRRNIAGNNDSGSDNNYHGDRIPLHFDEELEKALQIPQVRQPLITVVTLYNINGNLVVNG